MSDALRPGEIDLEAPAGPPAGEVPPTDPAPPAADPAGDPDGDLATDPPADAVGDPEPPKRAPSGAVAELIALRREKKELAQRLHQFESSPVLQRLTPEVQEAILEGRMSIAPPESTRAAEQARLTDLAEAMQLYKVDGAGQTVPDLEAAKRVDKFVRGTVDQAVSPVRHIGLADKAQANVDKAVTWAEQNGLDVDIVKEEFLSILSQPNGAEMLSQAKIAKQVWRGAIGRMHEEGRLTKKEAAAAKKDAPAAVITEPTGRRASAAAAISLSPGLQRVYAEAGLNPAKSFTATRPQLNLSGPIDLE